MILGVGCGVLLAILLSVSAAVYFERARVAALFVQRYLAASGIQSDVEFSRLGWGGFVARVRAGPTAAPDFTAEGMEVTLVYPSTGVVGSVTPQVASVRLIRPYLRVTYDGEKLSFGSLQRLIDEALAMDTNGPKPAVGIENGNLSLATPNGTLDLIADATIAHGRLEHLKAKLQKSSLKGNSFAADIAGGTLAADMAGETLDASADMKLDSVSFQGRSARELDLNAAIGGLKWQQEGGTYSFTLLRVLADLSAAATDAPEISASGSTTRVALEGVKGSFAGGRVQLSTQGGVSSELAGLRMGGASLASLKTRSAFPSLFLDAAGDAWSAAGDVRMILDAAGVQYATSGGGLSLASLQAGFSGFGTVKEMGADRVAPGPD